MFSSGSIRKTDNFAGFYWKYTTKLKINFLFPIGNGIIKRTGFALIIVIQNSMFSSESNERLVFLHDFTGSILSSGKSMSCSTKEMELSKELVLH